MIVLTRISLGAAEGGDPAKPVEEVGEADVDAFDRQVRDLVAPGADEFTRVRVGEVQLHPQVDGAAATAAEIVPGEPALEGVRAAAGGRLPIDDATLVVLGQGARSLFDDRGGGVAPAFDTTGLVEVCEEVGAESGAVRERADDVNHVVLQWLKKLGARNLRGRESGLGAARAGRRDHDKRRDHQQGHHKTGSY